MKGIQVVYETIKTNPKQYIVDYIAYQIANIFPLLSGLLLSEIFSMLESRLYSRMWAVVGVFVGTLLGRIVFVFAYSITNAYSRFSTSTLLWSNFVKALLKKPGAEPLNKTHGSVLNSLNADVKQVEGFISGFSTQFLGTVIFSVIAVIILVCTNLKVFVFSFSPVVFLFLLIRKIGKHLTDNRKKYRESVAATSALLGNILKNVSQIRIQGAEELVIQQLKKADQIRLKATIKDSMLRELILCLHKNAISIGTAILMGFYCYLAYDGYFSLKEFSLFIYYLNFISGSIQYLGSIIIDQKATQVSIENLNEISRFIPAKSLFIKDLFSISRDEQIHKESFSVLEVRDLSYTIPSGKPVLNQINLRVNHGELIVITGKVASGKTTLLRSILGLLEQQQGKIFINDKNVAAESLLSTNYMSYSPQNPSFFNTSIRENIFGKTIDPDREKKCAYYVALDGDIANNQIDLETNIGADVGKISGGQRSRLSLARMLFRDADVFVIDDISSALDNKTSQTICERLLSIKNKTFIIVTEDPLYLKRADRIVVLDNGNICFEGTYEKYCEYK